MRVDEPYLKKVDRVFEAVDSLEIGERDYRPVGRKQDRNQVGDIGVAGEAFSSSMIKEIQRERTSPTEKPV